MSGLTGGVIPSGRTAWPVGRRGPWGRPVASAGPSGRSRSQTRSIARRHSCEQKRCSGDRGWRTNPWQQPGRSQQASKRLCSDYPRGVRNGFDCRRFSAPDALPVALALTVPFLFARCGEPVSLLGLPPRPCPRRFPALAAAKAPSSVSRPKTLLTSLEQTPTSPRPASQPLPPAGLLIFGIGL